MLVAADSAGASTSSELVSKSSYAHLAVTFGKALSKQGLMRVQAILDALEQKPFVLTIELGTIFAVSHTVCQPAIVIEGRRSL